MIITDAAKEVFLEAITRTKKSICHMGLIPTHCGGRSLDLCLIPEEEATRLVDINGLKVDISEEDEETLRDFTFDAKDKALCLIPPQREECGGCHGGCCEGECDGNCDCGNCDGECDCGHHDGECGGQA